MSLSTATTGARPLSVPHIGRHFVKHISPSRCHLIKNGVRSFRSQRLIAHSSQVQRPLVLNGHGVGFHPLKSRRTIRSPTALNARCGVAETQTLTRKSASATIVSPPGKETLPMLDDGGSGFRGNGYTPYYRGDGSGGGSGGGLPSSGEFPWGDYWLYIFFFLLRFLIMNMIGEGSCLYKYEDGRSKPIRRYV